MTTPAWPTTLPQYVLRDGYAETLPRTGIETEMDAGPPKTRRRFTNNSRPFTVALNMLAAQIETFEDFFMNVCAGGTLPFTWVNPRSRAAGTFRFRPASPPQYADGGGEATTVTFDMEQIA